ncbi:hypothetical protein CS388_09480 [Porphyromonas gingivalis]|nr:hypothetical protein CS388_09480 [Porphyromonas gingivalis]
MKMQKGSICYKRKEKLLPAPNPIGGKMATKGDEMPAPISFGYILPYLDQHVSTRIPPHLGQG